MSKAEYYRTRNIVITDVIAKSCYNSIHVDLSPVELTSLQRNKLIKESRQHREIQRLKKSMPVELYLKVLEFDTLFPLERSEYFLFLVNGSGLKFVDEPESSMIDNDEELEIIFNLTIPTACWKVLKGTKVIWWKDGREVNLNDINGRLKHVTTEIPDDGVLSYIINPCRPEDSGLYKVKIVSSKGDLLTSSCKQVFIKYEKPFFIRPLPHEIEIDFSNRLTNEDKIRADVILNCEYTGGSTVTITWHKVYNDGRTESIVSSDFYEISKTSNTAKLHVKNILPEKMESISTDGVLEPGYMCIGESCIGTVETRTKLIVKKFPPKLLTKLEDMKFHLGSQASIICRAIGWPAPRLTWILNGVFIGQNDLFNIVDVVDESRCDLFETVQMLRFTKIISEIEGDLKIVAKNRLGSDLQESHLSIMTEKPFFLEHLLNLNVKEGESIYLKAKISGHPPPKVTWSRNGKPLEKMLKSSDMKTIVSRNQYLLHLQKVKTKLAGKITCRAVNISGEAVSSADLIVIDSNKFDPPKFTKELEDTTMLEGCRVVMECGVTGVPQPGINWTKCGEELFENSWRHFELEKSDDGSLISLLVIESARKSDSGEYQVVISSSSGQAMTSANLTIIGKIPKIVDKKFYQDVCINDECTFLVVVSGGPDVEAKWFKDDKQITTNENKYNTLKKIIDHQNINFELFISNACHDDEGFYEVRVSNESGEVATSGSLKVIDPYIPTFKRRLPSISSCREGKKCSFECVAFGRPTLQFKWHVNDKLISNNNNNNDRILITRNELISSDHAKDLIEVKEILTIKKAETSDAGIIKMEVQNDSGSNSSESKFSVTSAPTPVKVEMVPPVIVEDLKDRLAELNEACCFTVLARGRPTPEVQWFRNELELTATDRIMILNAKGVYQLIIKSVLEEDSAVYKARIWNEAGERSTCSQLILKNKLGPNGYVIEPMFQHFLEDKNLEEGEECTFSVTVTGLPPLSVTWFKDDVPLKKNDPRFTFEDDVTNSMYRLKINKVITKDTGRYAVRVENERGKKMNSAMLTVRELETRVVPARLLDHDDTEGKTIMELLCMTTNLKPDKDDLKRRWFVEKGYFAVDDRGQMVCQKWKASSNSDYIFMGDQDATFLGPEEFVFQKQIVELRVMMKEPYGEVLWLKDGNVISGGDDDDDDPKYEMSSFRDGLVHTFIINDVCDDDEGVYTFKVLSR